MKKHFPLLIVLTLLLVCVFSTTVETRETQRAVQEPTEAALGETIPEAATISIFEPSARRDAILEELSQWDDPELQRTLEFIRERVDAYERGEYAPPTPEEEAAAEAKQRQEIQAMLDEARANADSEDAQFSIRYDSKTHTYSVEEITGDDTPIEPCVPAELPVAGLTP